MSRRAALVCAVFAFLAVHVSAVTYQLSGRQYTLANPTITGSKLPLALYFNGINCGCGSGDDLLKAANKVGIKMLTGSVCAIKSSWDLGSNKDLDFTDAVIKDISSKYSIDSSKILLSGWSMGGMHVSRYACFRGSKVLAVSPSSCAVECANPTTTVHWLGMAGTADTVCPRTHQLSVNQNYAKLVKKLKCPKQHNPNQNTDTIQMCNGKHVDLRHYPAGHSYLHPEVQLQIFKSIISGVEVRAGMNDSYDGVDQFLPLPGFEPVENNGSSSNSTVVAIGVVVLVLAVVGAGVFLFMRHRKQQQQKSAAKAVAQISTTSSASPAAAPRAPTAVLA